MPIDPNAAHRITVAKVLRDKLAADDNAAPPSQNWNTDKSNKVLPALYAKALVQNKAKPGLPDGPTFDNFLTILNNGSTTADGHVFPKALLGGTTKLNGPLGAFALQLDCKDSAQFGATSVPAPPVLSSEEYATELIELYWASLLRDVPFSEYDQNNKLAVAAAAELNSRKDTYAGPLDAAGNVTPQVLFRGGFNRARTTGLVAHPNPGKYFAGELLGPYLSQFCVQNASLGVLPIVQKYVTTAPHVDFMLDEVSWRKVQSGQATGASLSFDRCNPKHLHDGRGLAAYTHEDELYQAYFIAYLVIKALGIPYNPTSPYAPTYPDTRADQPFGTFGGPDIAATLAAVAKAAINAVWYQKWVIHLRHRPESGGGLLHYQKNGVDFGPAATLAPSVLDSQAVKASRTKFDSWFLAQAFPEGSPPHPAYPTGHGAVAGACITVLKFFFDGGARIQNPVMPSADGTMLMPYTGADADHLTVNGELHKLAHNISFGHGIHAGIHWRSDTDFSLLLGEEVAISFLTDQVMTYSEKVDITFTKMDGATCRLKNE